MARSSVSAFATRRAPFRRAALASLVALAGWRYCSVSLDFMAPVMLTSMKSREGSTAVEEKPKTKRKSEEEEFKDRLKDTAFSVLMPPHPGDLGLRSLGFRPDDIIPGTTHGLPYVTCFVEYQDRSQRDEYGTVQAKDVLEEWVMRGDDQTVSSFTSWRQTMANTASLQCVETASKSVDDTMCIECVSPANAFAMSDVPNRIVGTVHPSSVMTFSGLDIRSCIASSFGPSGRFGAISPRDTFTAFLVHVRQDFSQSVSQAIGQCPTPPHARTPPWLQGGAMNLPPVDRLTSISPGAFISSSFA
eukprot:s1566_g7.t1